MPSGASTTATRSSRRSSPDSSSTPLPARRRRPRPRRRPTPRSTTSRRASARCCATWRAATCTRRSPCASGSRPRRSRRTCRPCCASSSSPTATSSRAGRSSAGSSNREAAGRVVADPPRRPASLGTPAWSVEKGLGGCRLQRSAREDLARTFLPRPSRPGRVVRTGPAGGPGREPKGVGMADRVLFISWGSVVRGREERALEVFNEILGFYGRLQQEGRIESIDVALLVPARGVRGYVAVHGSTAQLGALREDEEYLRLMVDSELVVEDFSI